MKLRILHLDPDPQYATTLALRLCALGFDLEHTTDIKEAFSLLVDRKFDVLICAMNLNTLDGGNFIGGIKKMIPSLHILVITNQGNPEQMEAGFANGADEYLVKDLTDTQDNILNYFNNPRINRLIKPGKL